MNKIAILIPVFNKIEYTKKCLDQLCSFFSDKPELAERYKIIVIDDASTDGTANWIQQHHPQVIILHGDGNLWWSGGINMGAEYAIKELHCDYLLLWNNDIQVEASYFVTVLELLKRYDKNTILGSKIYANPEKTLIWSMGGVFDPKRGTNHMIGYLDTDGENYSSPRSVDWITGMGTIVPSDIVKKIGYWDQINFPQYFGDSEFTYRAKINGFKNIICPELAIWNDVTNTGLLHAGKLKLTFKMLTDKRSVYNLKVNLKFYKLYAESITAYYALFQNYFRFFGGFIKWKVLNLFGVRKKDNISF